MSTPNAHGDTQNNLLQRIIAANEEKEIAQQRLAETEVKLRMSIGALFSETIIQNENFRNGLITERQWTPSTPAIPCEWSRTISDVHDAAKRFFNQGHNTVMIPLIIRENGEIKLVVDSVTKGSNQFAIREDIAAIYPSITMGELYELMPPNGKWETINLDESDQNSPNT